MRDFFCPEAESCHLAAEANSVQQRFLPLRDIPEKVPESWMTRQFQIGVFEFCNSLSSFLRVADWYGALHARVPRMVYCSGIPFSTAEEKGTITAWQQFSASVPEKLSFPY